MTTKRVQVNLPLALYNEVKELCKENKVTMNEFIHSIIEMNKENYLGQVEEYLTGNKVTNEDAITWLFNIPKRSRSSEHIEFLLKKYNQDKPKDKQVYTMDDLNRALMQEEINNFKTE